MYRAAIVTLFSFAMILPSGGAEAKRKRRARGPAAACGLRYLPLIEGRTWTYQYAVPPLAEGEEPAADAPKARILTAKTPDTFTVRVKSVKQSAGKTTITLEESYRKVVRNTVLTCTSKGLTVPIDSFYFSGELPGALGFQIEDLELNGEMYPGKRGLKKGDTFWMDIKAKLLRSPGGEADMKHLNATIELERQIVISQPEEVEVEHGIHDAHLVEVELSGRTSLEPTPDKQSTLTIGKSRLWFADNLGLVRTYNRLGQGWELATFTDADGKAIEL